MKSRLPGLRRSASAPLPLPLLSRSARAPLPSPSPSPSSPKGGFSRPSLCHSLTPCLTVPTSLGEMAWPAHRAVRVVGPAEWREDSPSRSPAENPHAGPRVLLNLSTESLISRAFPPRPPSVPLAAPAAG